MEVETDKYAVFSKAFAELSGESQDKLVDMAHRLLETHQLVGRVINERVTYPSRQVPSLFQSKPSTTSGTSVDLPGTNSFSVMVRMDC